MMSKTFKGANLFMSRNLVSPEIFDTLHDALKQNGAEVFLCCDPSRNGPNDYHVISSNLHEKFVDLRTKGCNLLGPQCVLSCAKEHRLLPKQGYTCCLALDGVKVLASGFDVDEKIQISKLVTAMGGVMHMKASLDVSFVIVKSVLSAKYKWAVNTLKKPVVTISWLYQCWIEHRVVPQDSYRVLPFTGLIICVTKVPADERKEMEKLVNQNGGKYSAELTKKCTHLVCDAPEGDKFEVAKRWGHIQIVTRKWFDQSVSRRACLNEESYPVQGSCTSNSISRTSLKVQHSQDKLGKNSIRSLSSVSTDENSRASKYDGLVDLDLEATISQNMSLKFPDDPINLRKEDNEAAFMHPEGDANCDGCVADDSQNDDNDLYLSDCRIFLVGFDVSEMRKLVNMVREGGGSRYMALNEKLTHIVVGSPSEIEKKEARGYAAAGVISVVKKAWLEECDREKKEIPVLRRHIGFDLIIPKDLVTSNKRHAKIETVAKEGNYIFHDDQIQQHMNPGLAISADKRKEPEIIMNKDSSAGTNCRYSNEYQPSACIASDMSYEKIQSGSNREIQDAKSAVVFKSKLFQFSNSFPEDRRAEVVQWITQGGGEMVSYQAGTSVHFIVECHGAMSHTINVAGSTTISTHWIRSCLEDEQLLDVGSHILYSPLPCQIPLPGFQKFRFCVSHYAEKDRLLLRNLCFVLGAKFAEKLTKKVTHLLCMFTNGPKYEAACKWGIVPVKCEWIYECVKQDEVVPPGPYFPKEVTSQDREAGVCTVSQYPTQAVRMVSANDASQLASQSINPKCLRTEATGGMIDRAAANQKHHVNKRAKLSETDSRCSILSSLESQINPICEMNAKENYHKEKPADVSYAVPDVAAAIENLLEETAKIHDQKSPRRSGCVKSLFSSDCSILGQDKTDPQSGFGSSKHWINRTDKKEENGIPFQDRNICDGFSETQTESQVVGYEEDLAGRQMIIDRVRSSMN